MKYRIQLSAVLFLSLIANGSVAQPAGEAGEIPPEVLDANFTEADAAREASLWRERTVERTPADPLAEMSAAADLVVRGTVTGQEVVHDAGGTPYTHTTLDISEVLEGGYGGSEITVVQEGGPLRDKPDEVLILSHTHYFTPGQEELLFLQLNPDSPHPYSRVVIKNRFGVLNGKVFNENGRGLIYTEQEEAPGYTLSLSRNRHPHPRFSDFKIGPHEFSKRFSERDEEVGNNDYPASTPLKRVRPGYQAGVDVSTFKNALARQGGYNDE